MAPKVDLVLVFRSASGKIEPKALARQNARQASEQYGKLLQALKSGGLLAVGKRGERDGQLLVLVQCPSTLLKRLAQRERCVVLGSLKALLRAMPLAIPISFQASRAHIPFPLKTWTRTLCLPQTAYGSSTRISRPCPAMGGLELPPVRQSGTA